MDKKKIIMLLILLFVVIGFTTSTVTAKTYSKNVKINSGSKNIGSSNYLYAEYDSKYSKTIFINIVPSYPHWNYVTKANVKYVKKVKGKNKYTTKTYKAKIKYYTSDWTTPRQKMVDSSIVVKKIQKGWKPISAKVYYNKKIYKGTMNY